MRAVIVGIDDFGDLELNKVHAITVAGREIDFIPILHVPGAEQTAAARSLGESVTLRFGLALLRAVPTLRRMFRGQAVVAEIERFEYAPMLRLIGWPFALVAHNEGDPRVDKMDSILSRYWYVNSVAEGIAVRLARRVYGVTPRIRDRLAGRYPSKAGQIGVLTVSVDTDIFGVTPFDLGDGKLRVVYAGRLDEFKDPPLMFRAMRRLNEQLGGAFEFHYCGIADPRKFPEFAAIEDCTIRHGALNPPQVAAVMAHCHIGTLVSYWEGMPCFLLELLSSGRPFGGLRLEQFDQVVEPGVNGRMVERSGSVAEDEVAVSDAILALWNDIRSGRIDPARVHEKIEPWSVTNQLSGLFVTLRAIARTGAPVPRPKRTADMSAPGAMERTP